MTNDPRFIHHQRAINKINPKAGAALKWMYFFQCVIEMKQTSDFLSAAFVWEDHPFGFNFWNQIYMELSRRGL